MRFLGDEYLRHEWKQHKTADAKFVVKFYAVKAHVSGVRATTIDVSVDAQGWRDYLNTVLTQTARSNDDDAIVDVGASLQPKQTQMLNDSQRQQLNGWQREAFRALA
jgi:hypothetical protein